MISRISISNYALISELTLNPTTGFNTITGATGAGKSIIMGAIALLQGKKFDSNKAENHIEKSSVEVEILLPDGSNTILRREIMPSGRTKSFVDNNPVSLTVLSELATKLIDIHSQHQNLKLADPDFQLETIDLIADNNEILNQYSSAYINYKKALKTFADKRAEIEATTDNADFLEYQLKEFDDIDLKENEDIELEEEYEKAKLNADISKELFSASNILSSEGNFSAITPLYTALFNLQTAASIDKSYLKYVENLQQAIYSIDAVADSLNERLNQIDSNPQIVDLLKNQLNKITKLKAKHKVDTSSDLMKVKQNIKDRLDSLKNADTILKDLEIKARRLKKNALEIAAQITQRRHKAAEHLVELLTQRAQPLGMDNLQIEIKISSGKLSPTGVDQIEFLFAFNKNQQPHPLTNRASGGELARLMLALKSITASHQSISSIIFDEIDTGVSGDIANRMAKLMQTISKDTQVITITHLPAVAALADTHFKVFKLDDEKSTKTHITELNQNQRIQELALMLSGKSDDDTSLAAAKSLLNNNKTD